MFGFVMLTLILKSLKNVEFYMAKVEEEDILSTYLYPMKIYSH